MIRGIGWIAVIFRTYVCVETTGPLSGVESMQQQCCSQIHAVAVSKLWSVKCQFSTPNHLLLDSAPTIVPLIFRWELDKKFKNCWSKSFRSFRTSKILTLLYQQFLNLLISQRDMSGPRLGELSNNIWSGGTIYNQFELGSEIVTGTQTKTLKWSPLSPVYFKWCWLLFYEIRSEVLTLLI